MIATTAQHAWAARAVDLSVWAMQFLVNRTDAYGIYRPDGSTYTAKDGLTQTRLLSHFRGEITIGLHVIGTDNLCRFVAWDFDQHRASDPHVSGRNLAAARALVKRLERLGLHPLLEDSNANGGYHVWVLLDRPRPAADVYAWARDLCPEGAEAFPKQAGVTEVPGPGHYGNYIRAPGRHHKRPHWSRFLVGDQWYEGEDAVSLLLEWTPSDAEIIPAAREPEDLLAAASAADHRPSAAEALFHLSRLDPRRANSYDDWLHVGMILHGVDPSREMLGVWDVWSRASDKYEPGACAAKWASFHGGDAFAQAGRRPLTIATLVMMANEDKGGGGPPVQATACDAADDGPDPLVHTGPHGVVLITSDAGRTDKRITVRFEVTLDGEETGTDLVATDTVGGVRAAWSSLTDILELSGKTLEAAGQKELKAWLQKLVSRRSLEQMLKTLQQRRAKERARVTERDDRPSMQEVATSYMREWLDLRFVVPDPMGLWSERFGTIIRQSEFTSRVEPGLLEALEGAHDYAAPTLYDPTKPIKHAQQVLKPVWCGLTGSLLREVNAVLGPGSKAATTFRRSIKKLWLAPETWMKFDAVGDTPAHVERMSLASRVREMVVQAVKRPEQWQRVLKGINAFFRVARTLDGRPVVWLGMRVDLCQGEIKGNVIPGVDTQHDLALLANRYGIADTSGVPVYITDDQDRRRLLVLNRSLCDYLIDCADEEQKAPLRAGETVGATEVLKGERIDTTTGEVLHDR
jgi:hypothetical protein